MQKFATTLKCSGIKTGLQYGKKCTEEYVKLASILFLEHRIVRRIRRPVSASSRRFGPLRTTDCLEPSSGFFQFSFLLHHIVLGAQNLKESTFFGLQCIWKLRKRLTCAMPETSRCDMVSVRSSSAPTARLAASMKCSAPTFTAFPAACNLCIALELASAFTLHATSKWAADDAT